MRCPDTRKASMDQRSWEKYLWRNWIWMRPWKQRENTIKWQSVKILQLICEGSQFSANKMTRARVYLNRNTCSAPSSHWKSMEGLSQKSSFIKQCILNKDLNHWERHSCVPSYSQLHFCLFCCILIAKQHLRNLIYNKIKLLNILNSPMSLRVWEMTFLCKACRAVRVIWETFSNLQSVFKYLQYHEQDYYLFFKIISINNHLNF